MAWLLIVVAAAVAMSPELVLGLTVSDSFRFNLLWTQQFDAVFRLGHLYPRWMPLAWKGLGSPTFYFYPPLFFWLTAAADAITAGGLSPERIAPIASLILLAVSGLTMHAWLKSQVGERTALIGAIAYMLAPYHLYDIYARGALAEASAYASVPLVMLALGQIAEGRRQHIAVLAIGYAALLLSHLPSALLVSLFLVAPYALLLASRVERRLMFIGQALAGGLLGIGVAAIYLIPAIGLLPFVSAGWFTSSFYQPENWYFWHIEAGPFGGRMLFIIPVSVAALLLATGAAMAKSGRGTLFWAILPIVLVLLIAGVVPPLWDLPGLRLVQFPWRALLVVEFAVVTLLALARPRLRTPFMLLGAVTLVFAYSMLGRMMVHLVEVTATGQKSAAAAFRSDYSDGSEYLPAGTVIIRGSGPDPLRIELPRLTAPQAVDSRATVQAGSSGDGGMRVLIETPVETRIVLPRFYFPQWALRDSVGRKVPVEPTPRGRLVSFVAPSGDSIFTLEQGRAPYEREGEIVTCLALLILAMTFIGTARKDWVRKRAHEPGD